MKVLVTIPCLLTGGTEIQTLSLVKALRAAGHQVAVACYFEHSPLMVGNYEQAGARLYLLSPQGTRPADLKATWQHLRQGLRNAIQDFRPDAAHVQYMAPGALAILALRSLGIKKIIATTHTSADIYSQTGLKLIRLLTRTLLTAFQCITLRAEKSYFPASDPSILTPPPSPASHPSPSTNHQSSAPTPPACPRRLRRGSRLSPKHFTIYNNIPDYIHLAPALDTPHSSLDTTLGFIGRLEPIKGADLLIPAFAKLQPHQACRLTIVGDGSLKEKMQQQAQDLGIADRITFAGRQPQTALQDYYDRIDILLMPSRSEGFGLTAVEGMARGCIPVVADTGGLPEVVRNGIDGLTHAPDSADALAETLTSLLDDLAANPAKKSEMQAAAIARAATFSTPRYQAAIAHLYSLIDS